MELSIQQHNALQTAAKGLHTACGKIDAEPNPTARDWAGFFAALAQFLNVLAPIIIPLFLAPKSGDK